MEFKVFDKNVKFQKSIETKQAILYFYDDKVFKKINFNPHNSIDIVNYHLIEEQEKTLKELDKISEKEFILPQALIYKNEIKTYNLLGYDMEYLKKYIELAEFLSKNKLSFKEKIELCELLSNIFINLEKYKICYWDIHASNIMIKERNIKVIDTDSATSKEVVGEFLYRVDLSCAYSNLASLLLSILYEIDEEILLYKIKNKRVHNSIKNNPLFKNVINFDGRIFYPNEYLKYFNEDYIEETRKLLLKK